MLHTFITFWMVFQINPFVLSEFEIHMHIYSM